MTMEASFKENPEVLNIECYILGLPFLTINLLLKDLIRYFLFENFSAVVFHLLKVKVLCINSVNG